MTNYRETRRKEDERKLSLGATIGLLGTLATLAIWGLLPPTNEQVVNYKTRELSKAILSEMNSGDYEKRVEKMSSTIRIATVGVESMVEDLTGNLTPLNGSGLVLDRVDNMDGSTRLILLSNRHVFEQDGQSVEQLQWTTLQTNEGSLFAQDIQLSEYPGSDNRDLVLVAMTTRVDQGGENYYPNPLPLDLLTLENSPLPRQMVQSYGFPDANIGAGIQQTAYLDQEIVDLIQSEPSSFLISGLMSVNASGSPTFDTNNKVIGIVTGYRIATGENRLSFGLDVVWPRKHNVLIKVTKLPEILPEWLEEFKREIGRGVR